MYGEQNCDHCNNNDSHLCQPLMRWKHIHHCSAFNCHVLVLQQLA